MNKAKVLLIGGSYPLPFGGGSINYIFNCTSSFECDELVVVTANAIGTENADFDKKSKYKIIRTECLVNVVKPEQISKLGYLLKLLYSFFLTLVAIIKYRPKVICITECLYFEIPIIAASKLLARKIAVCTYAEEMTQQNRPINAKIFKWVFTHCDLIFTVSDYTSSLVNSYGNFNEKIKKVIPAIAVKGNAEKGYNTSNAVKVLTVGRLERRKGQVQAIQAISKLHETYPNIEYNIVGGGPYKEAIEECIRNNNAGSYVHLLGKVSDEELNMLYQISDIFVMPHMLLENGDTEGCPTVFLEASYNKLPVIGGKAGGVSDAIKDGVTGFIVDPLSDELYNALEKLIISSDLRKELGENGYEYASQFVVSNQAAIFRESLLSL